MQGGYDPATWYPAAPAGIICLRAYMILCVPIFIQVFISIIYLLMDFIIPNIFRPFVLGVCSLYCISGREVHIRTRTY